MLRILVKNKLVSLSFFPHKTSGIALVKQKQQK